MSRRRCSSLQQMPQLQRDEGSDSRSPTDQQPENSMSTATTSWPGRAYLWFNAEFARIFDDKLPADESNKILPSLISFILGLLLVKVYGESADSVITKWYAHSKHTFEAICGILAAVTSNGIEILAGACVLLLFWIGALRIFFNLVSKFTELPRLCSGNSNS